MFSVAIFVSSHEATASKYVAGCIKMHEFGMQPKDIKADVKKGLSVMCSCQESEILKSGISQDEINLFVKNAGTSKIDTDKNTVATVVKINKIIQSNSVKGKCGGI